MGATWRAGSRFGTWVGSSPLNGSSLGVRALSIQRESRLDRVRAGRYHSDANAGTARSSVGFAMRRSKSRSVPAFPMSETATRRRNCCRDGLFDSRRGHQPLLRCPLLRLLREGPTARRPVLRPPQPPNDRRRRSFARNRFWGCGDGGPQRTGLFEVKPGERGWPTSVLESRAVPDPLQA